MKGTIKLRITKEDASVCSGYCNNLHCLAATAARRQFKTKYVFALPKSIRVDGNWLTLSANGAHRVDKSYVNFSSAEPRRIRSDFKPFTVTLTKGLR